MKKILMSRGMGKTTQLLKYAHNLALKYPHKIIYFLTAFKTSKYYVMQQYSDLFGDRLATNLVFITSNDSIKNHNNDYEIVVDELDAWLNSLNIKAYTNGV